MSLNKVVHKWQPKTGLSLSYSEIDGGPVRGALCVVLRLLTHFVKDEGR